MSSGSPPGWRCGGWRWRPPRSPRRRAGPRAARPTWASSRRRRSAGSAGRPRSRPPAGAGRAGSRSWPPSARAPRSPRWWRSARARRSPGGSRWRARRGTPGTPRAGCRACAARDRVGVRVHEADGHGEDAAPAQPLGHAARLVLVELADDAAGVVEPLRDLEPVAAPDVRRRDVAVGVPQLLLPAAADLDHVAEAAGRDQRGRGEVARDQRVGGHGRAVGEDLDVVQVDSDCSTPRRTPSIGSGVDAVLAIDICPLASSKTQTSVNVPPTSTATRLVLMDDLPAAKRASDLPL